MPAVMHPHPEPEHHQAGEQRSHAFQQFTLRTADVDQVRRQCPGGHPGQQCQAPADVHAAHRLLLTGVAQESQNRRQHQNRLQPFTQQDQQAGEETQ